MGSSDINPYFPYIQISFMMLNCEIKQRKELYKVFNQRLVGFAEFRALYTTSDYLLGFEEKLIFFRFGRLTCEILDQPNKDDFVRKYIRKDIICN